MATREQLERWINGMLYERKAAAFRDEMLSAMDDEGYNRRALDFVTETIKVVSLPLPRIAAPVMNLDQYVKTLRPNALGHQLNEIYKWCMETGYRFEDCDNPRGLWRFVTPTDGHWEQTHAELKGHQPNMYSFVCIAYERKRYGEDNSIPPAPPIKR